MDLFGRGDGVDYDLFSVFNIPGIMRLVYFIVTIFPVTFWMSWACPMR